MKKILLLILLVALSACGTIVASVAWVPNGNEVKQNQEIKPVAVQKSFLGL